MRFESVQRSMVITITRRKGFGLAASGVFSILLFWLADSYDVCIHYPSAGEKETTISDWASRLVRDQIWDDEAAAKIAAEKSWIALDTLDCMLGPLSLQGLGQLGLHSVQIGATSSLDTSVELVIRFAPRSKSYFLGGLGTIRSMIGQVQASIQANSGSLVFHNIEHLALTRPVGPIVTKQQVSTGGKLRSALYDGLMGICGESQSASAQVKKRCQDGENAGISKECGICGSGRWCEESDCQEMSE